MKTRATMGKRVLWMLAQAVLIGSLFYVQAFEPTSPNANLGGLLVIDIIIVAFLTALVTNVWDWYVRAGFRPLFAALTLVLLPLFLLTRTAEDVLFITLFSTPVAMLIVPAAYKAAAFIYDRLGPLLRSQRDVRLIHSGQMPSSALEMPRSRPGR